MPIWARRVGGFLGIAIVVGAISVFVFPTRKVLAQQSHTDTLTEQVQELTSANDRLSAEIDRMRQQEQLERLARRAGFVRPGEELYRVLPPEPAGLYLPALWPFSEIRQAVTTASSAEAATTTTVPTAAPTAAPTTAPTGG